VRQVSVVAPCFNEAGNVPELVERLQRLFDRKGLTGEIVLVDDGSRDDTGAVIDRLAARHPNVVAVHHDKNRGIEAAWNSGVAAASGEYVCFIDADLQYLPEDVWRLYREIRWSHADLVQGYRSSVGRLRDSRYVLSKGLNFVLNAVFGMSLRDNKSGFVIALRGTMAEILRHRYRYHYFQTFVAVSARAKGCSLREVETLFESRQLGRSFMPRVPVRVTLLVAWDVVKGFGEFRLFRRRDSVLGDFLAAHPPSREDAPLRGWRRAWWRLFIAAMPVHAWMITRRAERRYRELKQSQWLPAARIRELQELKLRRLVHHAFHHVAYYRQAFDERGLKPEDIRGLDDLARLPLLDKPDVRDNVYLDLLSDNHDKRRILKITTSGSTGEPFVCYADRDQLEIRWAATQRSLEWTGYRFGDPQARLWHQTIGMSWHQILRERLDALLSRRIFIPAFEMSPGRVSEAVQRLRRHRPVLIDGYAECFNYLAEYVRSHELPAIRPKAIVSSAQVLPEESREAIERAFATRVFDKYGSREFSGIAYECEAHAGHHVVAESYVVEVLRDGRSARPGELGEVVITDLNNFCMPFIRYRIGDLAVAMDPREPCPCGRGLPRLGRIEGRIQAMIVGADGAVVPGSLFPHIFKDYDYAVRQFQVLQEEPGRILLKVVRATRFDQAVFEELLAKLRLFLGRDTKIDVAFVDAIPLVGTGKRQTTLSRVPIDFQVI
jgi:phenylacetate-coenzyme A ligase PaaK-like adenylate-forming protein